MTRLAQFSAWLQSVPQRLGALPARRVTWALVLIFAAWVVVDVFVLKLSGGLSRSTYDTMVRARLVAAAPDPRIVIIDIDEASLARMGKDFGRWPWPRDTLATVLDHVEKQQPAAVVWDIVFSDADRLSPGGDAAFDEAARRSRHSHFSVVRLPAANDVQSEITRAQLPGLWLDGAAPSSTSVGTSTVALIAPVLPAVAAGRLGFNNGYPDADGILRRYRHAEQLSDGSTIQSMAMSVARAVAGEKTAPALLQEGPQGGLMAWRKKAQLYPRVSFADVFAHAEGEKVLVPVPDFQGKVVIIGSTAPSLHDVHPTPLSPLQPGVESLATAIDNALHDRRVEELSPTMQATLAILMCVCIALWVQFNSVASLAPALVALPAALLGVSYLSLNFTSVFLDLNLSAGLALAFLAILRYWNECRHDHWCELPDVSRDLEIWSIHRRNPWMGAPLDRLMDVVERHAPQCRVLVPHAYVTWPQRLRWPELAQYAAVVGPADALQAAASKLRPALARLGQVVDQPIRGAAGVNRSQLVALAISGWAAMGEIKQ